MAAELAVLDVGHGSCAVLNDNGQITVFDAGLGSSLLEYLKDVGLSRVHTLLVSHADEDHIGGVIAVVTSEEVEIDLIQLNSDASKTAKGGRRWRQLLTALHFANKAGKLEFKVGLTTSNTGEFDGEEVEIEVLAPSPLIAGLAVGGRDDKGREIKSNTISAVFRLKMAGEPVALLTGDVDSNGLSYIIEDGEDIKSPFVVFPHHGGLPGGSVTEFTKLISEQTAATTIIFSNGRNVHDNPREEVISTLRKESPETRIICTQLSRRCSQEEVVNVNRDYLSPRFAKGRIPGYCCGGTIVVDLIAKEVLPALTPHSEFIYVSAPTALCRN